MFDSINKNAKNIYFRLNLSSKYYRLGNIWGDTEFLGHDIYIYTYNVHKSRDLYQKVKPSKARSSNSANCATTNYFANKISRSIVDSLKQNLVAVY